ncbi:MAG: flagellar hook-associated protein FlgL [Planctomycetota bacterium]
MIQRVTQQSVARSVSQSIRRATENLNTAQEQVATGRRISRLSDAPLDAARAHRLRANRGRLEQHMENLEYAQSNIEFTASTVQGIGDLFVEAKDICIRAADGATLAEERQALAGAADQLLETLVRQANAEYDGHYVLAGTADDAPPFTVQRSGGSIAAVTYGGSRTTLALDIAPRTDVELGETGTNVFSGTDAFDALIELRDLLRNTDGLSEREQAAALSDHIGVLREAHETVVDATSALGWRSNQLEFTRTVLEDTTLADTALISELEDADYAEAVSLLQRSEAGLQMALAISARMIQNTLLNYLE